MIALLPDDAKIIETFVHDVKRILEESYANIEILLIENGQQCSGVIVIRKSKIVLKMVR